MNIEVKMPHYAPSEMRKRNNARKEHRDKKYAEEGRSKAKELATSWKNHHTRIMFDKTEYKIGAYDEMFGKNKLEKLFKKIYSFIRYKIIDKIMLWYDKKTRKSYVACKWSQRNW
jgi:hypothetical protein